MKERKKRSKERKEEKRTKPKNEGKKRKKKRKSTTTSASVQSNVYILCLKSCVDYEKKKITGLCDTQVEKRRKAEPWRLD